MAGSDTAMASNRRSGNGMMMMMMGMSRRSRTRTRRKSRCLKSASAAAASATTFSSANRNNEALMVLASLLLLMMASSALGQLSSVSPAMGATNAYGEPIKWSFGGWAPLDGQQSASNKSQQQTTAAMAASVPRSTTPAPSNSSGQRQTGEALSVSASQPVQYSQPAELVANKQLAVGPAYAMPMGQRPTHFSAPAPAPILREHPLPHRPQHQHQPRTRGNTDRYRRPPSRHQPMHVLHTQHYVQHQAPPEMFLQQQQHQQQHQHLHHQRQLMSSASANHQRQMQHRQRMQHMQHMQQVHNARQHHMMMMQQQQQQPQYGIQPQMPNLKPPHVGSYRLVAGEQPVMFSQPQGDHIPVLEVSTRNESSPHHEENQQQQQGDNLNYQSALNKDQANEQPTGSNNIHEVKQKQEALAEQQKQQTSYLTIPVAVETDGDKVLTADDINEIEKHVIQVLPNLKTADQIVKVANDQISVANYATKDGGEQPPLGQIMHQLNYNEHQTTMKELEGELKQQYQQQQQGYEGSSTASTPPAPSSYAPSQATGAASSAPPASEPPPPPSNEEQYFVATGPLQEVGELDQDQLAEYNLIKNDLLHNFRYEPTRAHSGSGARQPPKSSTAPMSTHTPAPASVTRYFQHGKQQQHQMGYGGRSQPRATTKAMMMGRKVSEVMRPLIRTTPVPMTSPVHVPSLEPEKLDAIQLIAGHANDRRPLVVEAHQLVEHTPDGGIDYTSGANMSSRAPQQQQQDAVIEYVALDGDQQRHQQQQQQQQVYEVSGQPHAPVAEFQPMSAQQQQSSVAHSEPQHQTTPFAAPESNRHQEQLAAWSPNVASEHQQQQLELSDHAQHMAAELPATAGYNNFFQMQQEQAPTEEPQQQQQQSWRTKAGGRQPNPDAQYDGQIAKGEQEQQQQQQEHEQEPQPSGDQHEQQYQQQSADMDQRPQSEGQQQSADNGNGDNSNGDNGYQGQQQQTTPMAASQATPDGYQPHSTNSYVGGAQINHQHQEQPQYSYMKLDRDRQQSHLQQQQAHHQAQLQELQQQHSNYQTTTPAATTTTSAEQDNNNNNGYLAEQSRPSVQSQPESMMINESPMQVPLMDQQSLIGDPNQETNEQLSDDDGAKQRNQQPMAAAVYQVYQAYYAPKDHKPLPGYVRLSLDEFNELFRDAEIQYVDRNNMANLGPNNDENNNSAAAYAGGQPEVMRSAASEHQSILVDRRSIDRPEKRSSEARQKSARKLNLGRAMKKIISIRNSRQFESRQSESKTTKSSINLNSKTTTATRPVPLAAKPASNQQHKATQLPTTAQSKSKTLKRPSKLAKEPTASSQIKGQSKALNEKKTTKGGGL